MIGAVLTTALAPTIAAGDSNREMPFPLSSDRGSKASLRRRRFRVADGLGEDERRVRAEPNIALLQGMLEVTRHENEEGCLPVSKYRFVGHTSSRRRVREKARAGQSGVDRLHSGKRERFGI